MSRSFVAVAVAACLAGPASGQDAYLGLDSLEVGQVGTFRLAGRITPVTVDRILGESSMIVRQSFGGRPYYAIVKGRPTRGLADDKAVSLDGQWKVTGTEKIGDRTYYALEQQAGGKAK